jgi:heptosyltransferase-2
MTPDSGQTTAPVVLIPYVWIGDFVRGHSVVQLLRAQQPERPVDIVASTLCAPLADYMPGIRNTTVFDLPRGRLALKRQRLLAQKLRAQSYGQAIVLLRTWKSALAPWLAGIPVRTGFFGELRFGLINDLRYGERNLARMIDCMGALALPPAARLPEQWPPPRLIVPAEEAAAWRKARGLGDVARPVVTLSPGAVGKGKAWPVEHYVGLARALAADGVAIWVLGGPNETPIAKQIAQVGPHVVDLTGNDLRNAILALANADAAVTNDSGLMHVAAAIGTPTIAIFGPTSPAHWAPLNPLAAILEPPTAPDVVARARKEGNAALGHRRTADVPISTVAEHVRAVLGKRKT